MTDTDTQARTSFDAEKQALMAMLQEQLQLRLSDKTEVARMHHELTAAHRDLNEARLKLAQEATIITDLRHKLEVAHHHKEPAKR
jgi:tellurite resistance protein